MAVGRNGVSMRDERERRVEGGGLEAGRHPPATPRPGPGVLQKVDYSGVNGGGSRFEVSNEDSGRESPPTLASHLV